MTDHRYVDGRQHYGRAALVRTCDTGVFFWQTPAAAASWPASPATLRRLAAAFRASAGPSAGAGGDAGFGDAGMEEPAGPAADAKARCKRRRSGFAAGAAPECSGTTAGRDEWVSRKHARRAERAVARAHLEAVRQQRRAARREARSKGARKDKG